MLLIEGCIIIVLWGAASLLCGSLFALCTKHCLLLQLRWCGDVIFAVRHNYINLLVVLSHV